MCFSALCTGPLALPWVKSTLPAYYRYEMAKKMLSNFLSFQVTALLPGRTWNGSAFSCCASPTRTQRVPLPLLFLWSFGSSSKRQTGGSFSIFLGLRHKALCVIFSFLSFSLNSFILNEMRNERRKIKFNCKTMSSSPLSLWPGKCNHPSLTQESIQQHF